jgi:hypothetical protein
LRIDEKIYNSADRVRPLHVPQGQAGLPTADATSCAMKERIKVKINMKKVFIDCFDLG